MKNWANFWDWLMVKVVKNLNSVSMNDLLLLKREWEEEHEENENV